LALFRSLSKVIYVKVHGRGKRNAVKVVGAILSDGSLAFIAKMTRRARLFRDRCRSISQANTLEKETTLFRSCFEKAVVAFIRISHCTEATGWTEDEWNALERDDSYRVGIRPNLAEAERKID